MEIPPELATVVLAFGVDRLVYRLFLGERLTLNRFASAVAGGFLSLVAWGFLSPVTASWTSSALFGLGVLLMVLASSKKR